jgi:hypothetical protein
MAKIFIRFFSKSQQKWGVRTTYEFQLDGDDPEMVKQVFGSIKVPEPKPEPEPVIGFLEPEPF